MCSATQESECFGVRESHSEVKYERDSVQARLEHEAGQMRILREELEDTKQMFDSAKLEVNRSGVYLY